MEKGIIQEIDLESIAIPEGYELVKKDEISDEEKQLIRETKANAELMVISLENEIAKLNNKLEYIDDEEIRQIVQDKINDITFKKSLYGIDTIEADKKLN